MKLDAAANAAAMGAIDATRALRLQYPDLLETEIVSRARIRAQEIFTAQAPRSGIEALFSDVVLQIKGETASANASYRAAVPTTFVNIIGVAKLDVAGAANATGALSTAVEKDGYLLRETFEAWTLTQNYDLSKSDYNGWITGGSSVFEIGRPDVYGVAAAPTSTQVMELDSIANTSISKKVFLPAVSAAVLLCEPHRGSRLRSSRCLQHDVGGSGVGECDVGRFRPADERHRRLSRPGEEGHAPGALHGCRQQHHRLLRVVRLPVDRKERRHHRPASRVLLAQLQWGRRGRQLWRADHRHSPVQSELPGKRGVHLAVAFRDAAVPGRSGAYFQLAVLLHLGLQARQFRREDHGKLLEFSPAGLDDNAHQPGGARIGKRELRPWHGCGRHRLRIAPFTAASCWRRASTGSTGPTSPPTTSAPSGRGAAWGPAVTRPR